MSIFDWFKPVGRIGIAYDNFTNSEGHTLRVTRWQVLVGAIVVGLALGKATPVLAAGKGGFTAGKLIGKGALALLKTATGKQAAAKVTGYATQKAAAKAAASVAAKAAVKAAADAAAQAATQGATKAAIQKAASAAAHAAAAATKAAVVTSPPAVVADGAKAAVQTAGPIAKTAAALLGKWVYLFVRP